MLQKKPISAHEFSTIFDSNNCLDLIISDNILVKKTGFKD